MEFKRLVQNEDETHQLAGVLAKLLAAKGVVYLRGDLGAGKTTFCRGILREYGYSGAVKSPTFTLVEPYDLQWGHVFHFDLYRIADPEELEFLGVEDYLQGGHLCLVEWPERGKDFLPNADLIVEILVRETQREFRIVANSELGKDIVAQLTIEMRLND